MNLFRFIPGYESAVYETGREPALVMLLAFLITFICTRGYTRIARVRGWGSAHVGGVHMHHLVVGVVLAFGSGALMFAFLPEQGIVQLLLAATFGSGVALVLDEFALVFHLTDVYWEREGRKSIDAVVISVALGVVLLLHVTPFGGGDAAGDASRWTLTSGLALNIAVGIIAALKGKLVTAAVGVFVPPLAVVGAIRLAEPGSVWARRRYRSGGRKRRSSERRYARYEARWRPRKERVWDIIGGKVGRGRPDQDA